MVPKLQSFIQLLKTRGFVNQVPFTLYGKTYLVHDYGAPGTFLRQNIKQQWWKSMVLMQTNVFPIETSPLRLENLVTALESNSNSPEGNEFIKILRCNLQKDCRDKYLDILTLANSKLPFSIATIGECFCDEHTNCDMTDSEKAFLTRHSTTTEMVLQNYIAPSGVLRIFDYWLQLRLSWWKKFSKNPSKLRITSSSTNGSNRNEGPGETFNLNSGQNMSIVYDFPWGPETLEIIHNSGDELLRRLQEEKGANCMIKIAGTKSILPHCIQCSTNLEMATAAFLMDSFHERKSITKSKINSQTSPVLQLHPHITPFQAAIIVTSNQTSTMKELLHISNQLELDLLNAEVTVFNASEHIGTLNAHFKRNDQLGIPYTLILNENTLKDGVISSRDRDTEIKKPVHVSKAVEEICRNVKALLE